MAIGLPNLGMSEHLLACNLDSVGVVEKGPGDQFLIEIVFKNVGHSEGNWTINVAFEGEKWTWNGTNQSLILGQSCSKKLSWNGEVPPDAPVDSTSRLIVYYDYAYKALDWWIHVVSEAELAIAYSLVR